MRKKKIFIQVHIYILGPKLPRWNFLQSSQLSVRSGAHNLFRRFLDFSQFLTAISPKIVAPTNDGNENYAVHLKELSLVKQPCKRQRNAYSNCVPPLTNSSPASERYTEKTNTIFSHLQPARIVRSSLSSAWRYSSLRPSKNVIHFLIQRIVFPTGCTEKVGLIQ